MIWNEGRIGVEAAGLVASPLWRGIDVPRGTGMPVMLIPGFLAGDSSLWLLAGWLRRMGHAPRGSGIAANVDCSDQAVRRVERRVEELAERHGERVALVGHSRGGMYSRVLAVRRPDLVRQVITMGSPLISDLDDLHVVLRWQIRALQRLSKMGAADLIRPTCRDSYEAYRIGLAPDGCCSAFWGDLDADMPGDVAFTSIFSRSDGVLHWRACLDAEAELVEVHSSHCGMAFNQDVYLQIARALAAPPPAGARVPAPPVSAVAAGA